MRRHMLVLAAVVMSGSACHLNGPPVPPPVSASTLTQYYDLEVPADLEIKNADYSATVVTDVSGMNGNTGTTAGWRSFVKVFAVRRSTGENVLLVYEDIAHHKQPVQIIRLRSDASAPPGER
jgi:hypothetical protein